MPRKIIERYGDSILLAVCSSVAARVTMFWVFGYLNSEAHLTPSPFALALWTTLWTCVWYFWSHWIGQSARWPLGVSARWTALGMSACLIPLLYKPLCFSRNAFVFLHALAGGAILIMLVWPFFHKSRPPAEERLRKAVGRVLDFGAIPLLLMTLLLDPVYFAYLRWPEAEKFFYFEGYRFFGEIGQFLAWANAVYHGAWQGRDFFCLYGPVYIFSIVGMWKLAGKSLQALLVYWQLMGVLSAIAAYAFFRQFWRWRVMCALATLVLLFVSVLEYPLSSCRFTAALGAMALLAAHGRGVRGLLIPAGILAALALATSQEVGLATLVAVLVFVVCHNFGAGLSSLFRKVGSFAIGLLIVLIPLALIFSAHDALWPIVRNVIEYPRAVALGYGNYPFPRADAVIPINLTGAPLSALLVRIGAASIMPFYYGPAVYAACAAYLLVRLILRWRFDAFDSMTAALTASGIMMFGVALGRSDYAHLIFALPPAFLLHLLFIGRATGILKDNIPRWRTQNFRWDELLLCALFLAASLAFLHPSLLAQKTVARAKNSVEKILFVFRLPEHPPRVQGPGFMDVVDFVKERTNPDDYILALPNNSAYYYLTDRRNATRFCQFAMLTTDRQRAEVLEDVEKRRPKCVIYDIVGERVDELSDEVQFPRTLDFILQNYAGVKRFGDTLILLDGNSIPGWRPSEKTVLEWDPLQPEHAERLHWKGARFLSRDDSGLRLSVEGRQSELAIGKLALDSNDFYVLALSARIGRGNVARIVWTVNRAGKKKTYSKMFAVDMKGKWEDYRVLISTPQPPGLIESIALMPSDEPTEMTIRDIRLIRFDHLAPRE